MMKTKETPGRILIVELDKANLMNISNRHEDVACRYGRDEFLSMLPEADLETTCQRAEESREKVSSLSIQFHGQELQKISLSMRICMFPTHGQTSDLLIRNVDKALYQAKNNGRNSKVTFDNTSVEKVCCK